MKFIKFENLEITPELFYRIGKWCFGIIAVLNICNFFYLISYQTIFSGISSWVMSFFYFILSGFFGYLEKQLQPQITEEFASEDIGELINEMKKEKEKNDKHTRTEKKAKANKAKNKVAREQ